MYCILYLKQPYFIWVKTDKGRMRCDVQSSKVFHIIDSINIQLGPNWQQSTTKMAVARLRCDADSSEEFHIIDTIIYTQEKDSFSPLYRQPSRHRPQAPFSAQKPS